MKRSISNLSWISSKGTGLDENPVFLDLLADPSHVPLLLFPGPSAFNLSRGADSDWRGLVPQGRRPLFIVIDGTWTQANAALRKSALLRSLPRVSFETTRLSEYGFKLQPHPACLSSVEGVHRVIELLAERGWGAAPARREHDQMIEVFRGMVKFQLQHEPKEQSAD